MKRIKLFALIALMGLLTAPAFAEGLGYINYEKVIANYDTAKSIAKELDAKGMELQQYLMDKEKEFKSIDTPVKKQAFKDRIANEYKAKEEAYIKYRVGKEKEVFTKIIAVCSEQLGFLIGASARIFHKKDLYLLQGKMLKVCQAAAAGILIFPPFLLISHR